MTIDLRSTNRRRTPEYDLRCVVNEVNLFTDQVEEKNNYNHSLFKIFFIFCFIFWLFNSFLTDIYLTLMQLHDNFFRLLMYILLF